MEDTARRRPNGWLIRQVSLSLILVGAALAFVLIRRSPGWEPFTAVGVLALGALFAALLMWRGSNFLVFLALAALVLAMTWEPGKPWGAVVGLILVILRALKNVRIEHIEEEGEQPAP